MLQRMVAGFAGLALAAGLMLQSPASAAAPGALGFVDTQKVFQSYKGAQSAQDRFRKEAQDYQEELVGAQRKLEEARKAGKSSDEVAKMQKKFEDELKPKKAKVEALDRELSGKIKKQIEAAIAQVAKAKAVPTVVDKAVVLYGGTDLTDDVLKQLNK